MPILNHNDLKKVEEYQNFVRTSPFANATQEDVYKRQAWVWQDWAALSVTAAEKS